MPNPGWTHHRAKVASLTRSRPADDPELAEARQNLKAARLESHIVRILEEAPPLSDDQRRRLAGLFAGGASQ